MLDNNEKKELWIKKYEPSKISEIQGHSKDVELILDYIKNYKKQKKKSLLLYGQSGNGKTSIIHAIAKELNYELIEVDASDDRNKDTLNLKVGNAIRQQSLFFPEGKIILIDEVDGISGFYDRGATTEIVNIIKNSKYPIIMTANDPFDKKFSNIRNSSLMLELKTLAHTSISKILEKICEKEKIKFEKDIISSLARRAGGDARGAINDLQSISGNKKSIEKEDLNKTSQRRQIENIMQSLMKVFKTTDLNLAITAFEDSDVNQDEQFLWLEQNIPLEYEKTNEIYEAYNSLSKADVFRGRIKRQQNWHFQKTINFLLTCGIALSKDEKYKKFVSYKRNDRILSIWILNNSNAKKKSICAKIAKKNHQSLKSVFKNNILHYKMMAKNDNSFLKGLIQEYELDEDEVAWLCK